MLSVDRIRVICGSDIELFQALCPNERLEDKIGRHECVRNILGRPGLFDRFYTVISQTFLNPKLNKVCQQLQKVYTEVRQTQAKDDEWAAVAHTLRSAAQMPVDHCPCPPEKEAYIKKIERVIYHALFLGGLFSEQQQSRELAELIYESGTPITLELKYLFSLLEIAQGSTIVNHHLFNLSRNLQAQYPALVGACENIKRACTTGPTSDASLVLRCEHILHSALLNPAYSLLCVDETIPCIQFLHRIAFSLYSEPELAACYTSCVEKILSKNCPTQDMPLKEALEHTTKKLSNLQNTAALYSHSNLRIGRIATELYGAHKVVRLMGPGQVLQGMPNPIFLMVLQAMENRRFIRIENDPFPYLGQILINMQDLTKPHERPSCIQLMELNRRYPFSFFACTIGASAPDAGWSSIVSDTSFMLTDENRGKYYFPPFEKERWKKDFPLIARCAEQIVPNHTTDGKTTYYELLKLGMCFYFDVRAIQYFHNIPLSVTQNAAILALQACFSGVDRAGSAHAIRLFACGLEAPTVVKLLFGRAVDCWGRCPNGANRVGEFATRVSLEQSKQFLKMVCQIASPDIDRLIIELQELSLE